MILLNLTWIIIITLSVLILILSLSFKLILAGNLKYSGSINEFQGIIHFGGKSRGIIIFTSPRLKIGLGKYDQPLFTFSFRKRKAGNKFLKNKKETLKYFLEPDRISVLPLFKRINFDHLVLKGTLGLSNPMHSGLIYGFTMAAQHAANSSKFKIEINPNFNAQPETDLQGSLGLRFKPIVLAWYAFKMKFK